MVGLAENILEREGHAGRVTRIECTTTVSPKPFTIEVGAVGQYSTSRMIRGTRYLFVVCYVVVPPGAVYDDGSRNPLTAVEYTPLLVVYVPRSARLCSTAFYIGSLQLQQ